MRKEFEENEESENKSENNLETQDEIDDETFQKILEKEFIEREKRITAALFADDDVEDIKFTKEELDNSYQEFLRRIEREKKENTEFSEELVPDVDAVRRKEAASDEKRVISIEEIRDRRKKTAEREMREEVSKEANTEDRMQRIGRIKRSGLREVVCTGLGKSWEWLWSAWHACLQPA